MTATPAFVWFAARDGSIHATRPPILAAGQPTLCARGYARVDLRILHQPASGPLETPKGACATCSRAAAIARTSVRPA